MKTKRFHNIFDLENCNKKINDPKILRNFLEELVRTVKMTILEGPIIAQGKPELISGADRNRAPCSRSTGRRSRPQSP